MLRMEFTNVLNHPYFNFPSGSNANASPVKNALGQYTSGFGYINVFTLIAVTFAAVGPRGGTLVGRFRF